MTSALGTMPCLLEDPVIARTAYLARELLAPRADYVAEHGVPRSHLDALADAGTLSLAIYEPSAPLTADAVRREAAELLAAADGATWFVSAQHHYPVQEVAASANEELRERWLKEIGSGRVISGIAMSHLRRPQPAVTATRRRDGWRIQGQLRWVTGWSVTDLLMIGATTPDDDIVFALVPWGPDERLGVVRSQDLWSMNATRTVTVDIDALEVPASMVVKVVRRDAWLEWDSCYNSNVNPAVFGVIRATSAFLTSAGLAELSVRVSSQGAELRERAYALRDRVGLDERLDEKRVVRAAAIDLACRSVTACVTSAGARGMQRGSSVGRLVAETFFHVVQGQSPAARGAMMDHLSASLPR
jgi:alkylation response protein AidB-like acyl-CoA dehydrogenase